MGQSSMPMITRLGNTQPWFAPSAYNTASAPFFQRTALKELLCSYLTLENYHAGLWASMLPFLHEIRKSVSLAYTWHHGALCEYFTTWELVYFKGLGTPFDEWMHELDILKTVMLMEPRVTHIEGLSVVDAPLFSKHSGSLFATGKIALFYKDMLPVWVSMVCPMVDESAAGVGL